MQEEKYLASLLEDFAADSIYFQNRKIHSVFIGGGTPSLLSGEFYRKLFSGFRELADFETGYESTLEANPGTAEANRFSEYRKAGINRLSIGIQSFSDQALSVLGRVHDSQQAKLAIDICREANFDNFNLDLMYGLPSQNAEEALLDLKTAIEYKPTHISWYQLTVEPNTAFYNKPPELPKEEVVMDMQSKALQHLTTAGYKRYETSAYGKSEKQSKHNLNYWLFGDYIGIGAGAHGKITLPEKNQILRTRKVKQPANYLSRENNYLSKKNNYLSKENNHLSKENNYLAEQTIVTSDDLNLEFMMNALRLTNGFERKLFESRTGNSFSSIGKKIGYLQAEGLLHEEKGWIKPSQKGQLFVNSLLEEFL